MTTAALFRRYRAVAYEARLELAASERWQPAAAQSRLFQICGADVPREGAAEEHFHRA
ncbi:MAG: hypothetical protein IPI06_09715 [Gammaproteobacteria bacterium]|nr:hypothetical protein [Gammaproteobacteria bacterium]